MRQLSMSTNKGIFVLVLLMMLLICTPRSWATPLYGGYNGESTAWTEYNIAQVNSALFTLKITLGVDTNSHAWTKVRFSIVPFITRLEFTYDSFDILSGIFSTFLPWPVLFGSEIETAGEDNSLLRWFGAYVIVGVTGFDSENTIWTESGIPGVYGSGKDNMDNEWTWIKFLGWLFGVGEDFTIEEGSLLNLKQSTEFEKELSSLQDYVTQKYSPRIQRLLEQLTSRETMTTVTHISNTAAFTTRNPLSSEIDSLSVSIGETVFTEEMKTELNTLLSSFAQDMQPLLKQITERITNP